MLSKWKSLRGNYRARGIEYILMCYTIESMSTKEPTNRELKALQQMVFEGLSKLREEYNQTSSLIERGASKDTYINNIMLLTILWRKLLDYLTSMESESQIQIPRRTEILYDCKNELTKLTKIIKQYEKTNS